MDKASCSSDILQAVMEHSFDGVWIYDSAGKVIYVNRAALEYNGAEAIQVLGRTWREIMDMGIFHGSAAQTAFLEKRQATEELLNSAGRHLLCTATPILDSTGEITQVITNVRDITELFELATALDEKNSLIECYQKELLEFRERSKGEIVAESPQMRHIMATIDRMAATDATVLLLGESGVGKDAIARRLHAKSGRARKEMVIANCGAIPPHLMESEFFGYEKGAFTGASQARQGLFEAANGGTLMLDEVGDLEAPMQVKLLRALQEGKIRRLGNRAEISVDARIIAATNKDLAAMVKEGGFRADLFYRLNVIPIHIPPLRERLEDLRRLIPKLLQRYNIKYNLKKTLSPEVSGCFETYPWPGNIRELDNLIERLVLICPDAVIGSEWLPGEITGKRPIELPLDDSPRILPSLKQCLENAERALLGRAAGLFHDTRSIGRALGVSHVTVARKLKEYGISTLPGRAGRKEGELP